MVEKPWQSSSWPAHWV